MNSDFSEGIREYSPANPGKNPDTNRPEPGINDPQKNDQSILDV